MPESMQQPTGIQVINLDGTLLNEYLYVDTVIDGEARIYGKYNITTTERNECDKTYISYIYDEGYLYWNPPSTYVVNNETIILDINSRASVESYVSYNSFEIMGYIKQIKASW